MCEALYVGYVTRFPRCSREVSNIIPILHMGTLRVRGSEKQVALSN